MADKGSIPLFVFHSVNSHKGKNMTLISDVHSVAKYDPAAPVMDLSRIMAVNVGIYRFDARRILKDGK